ncbi:hypothetical protein SVIOM74S_05246 [Streptomyces violarus]
MTSALFGPRPRWRVLPLMLFHQMQLMVCAVIAKRRSHDPRPEVTAAGASRRVTNRGRYRDIVRPWTAAAPAASSQLPSQPRTSARTRRLRHRDAPRV